MKILIELPTWLGDTVMATPAIENLINHFSNSQISLIGSSSSIELLEYHPRVSDFIVLDKKYLSLLRTARKIGKFDNFFSFRKSFRSSFFKLFLNSKKKYQFKKIRYTKIHQVEKYNSFINDSINRNYIAGKLNIYTKKKLEIKKSNKILGINPGASYGSSKRWSPKKFAEVALEFSHQFKIIIYGGNDEKDIAVEIESILAKNGVIDYKNLAGRTSITELVNSISQLDLFITGDSGPMHIAASFEIPTIAIFGPTRDEETSQWKNKKSEIVKKNLSCQPCMKRTCPLGHNNCMRMVDAKDIISLVDLIKLNPKKTGQ